MAVVSNLAFARDVELVVETDFAALRTEMHERRLPLMLLVSQSDCPYCERLKSELLRPMLISGEYRDKVIIREVITDEGDVIVGFDGTKQPASALSSHYRAWVSPILLFLDARGEELTQRIVGYQVPELFPYDVDQAIEKARALVRQSAD